MPGLTEANRKWWVLIGTSGGLFLLMLDSTVVALALPSIQGDIGASNGRAVLGSLSRDGVLTTEVIRRFGPWRNLDDVELATYESQTGQVMAA